MSSHSYSDVCPNCGSEQMNCCAEGRPFEHTNGECPDCGFYYYTQTGYRDLEDLNDIRVNVYELEALKELPEQDKDLLNW